MRYSDISTPTYPPVPSVAQDPNKGTSALHTSVALVKSSNTTRIAEEEESPVIVIVIERRENPFESSSMY